MSATPTDPYAGRPAVRPFAGVAVDPTTLVAVLALHREWRRGEGGRRADLTRAYLSGAYLSGADLSGAVLGRTIQRIGPIDAWTMVAVRWADGPRIACGCRWFTVPQAREHWGPGCADRREHGDIMLAGLDALMAICRAHGWEGC